MRWLNLSSHLSQGKQASHTRVWSQQMEGWGWFQSVRERQSLCLPSQSKLSKGLQTVQTHFPEILTLHKLQEHVPRLAASKQVMLTGKPWFWSSIHWPHLASCSTEEEVTSAYVPKCLGHCLIHIRNSRSICGRKDGRKEGREGASQKAKVSKSFRKLETQQKCPFANMPVFWGMQEVCNMSFTKGDWVPCENMDNGTSPWFGYTVLFPIPHLTWRDGFLWQTLCCLPSIHSCFFLNEENNLFGIVLSYLP